MGGIFWPILTDTLFRSFERKKLSDGTAKNPQNALKVALVTTLLICVPLLGASCFLVKESATTRRNHDPKDLGEKPPTVFSRGYLHNVSHCLTRQQLVLSMALFFTWIGAIIPFGFIPMLRTSCCLVRQWDTLCK